MTEGSISLATIYKGWDVYQQQLVKAIAPLSSEQLALRAAPQLRSVGIIATHIVAVRARWFHSLMGEGEGNTEFVSLENWDREGMPTRSAAELIGGLETTWQVMQQSLVRWTLADLDYVFEGTRRGEEYKLSRQWVIWHVLEHDLHHGGELSFALGMHGVAAIDL
ncbi:MAG: hypothetical protein NVS4B7_21040 [Ktedonobacteraceae bacterium]